MKYIWVHRCVCGEDVFHDDSHPPGGISVTSCIGCARGIVAESFKREEIAEVTRETLPQKEPVDLDALEKDVLAGLISWPPGRFTATIKRLKLTIEELRKLRAERTTAVTVKCPGCGDVIHHWRESQ